jgi:HlyD family secretion protein
VATVASIKKEGTPIAALNISEIDINSIKVGQQAVITVNSVKNKKFAGTVIGIDRIGTTSNGVANYPVIIKFTDDASEVLPNMGVEVNIIIQTKENVLMVPSAAITTLRNKKIVKVITDTGTKNAEITTGISDSDNIEILSGVNEGDKVQIDSLPIAGFTTQPNGQNSRVGGFGVFGGAGGH